MTMQNADRRRLAPAAVLFAVALFACPGRAVNLVHVQDFESSPAAGEYASGDFDPIPIAGGEENVFEPSADTNSPVGQVVSGATTNNGNPTGPPQVFGQNALKLDADPGDHAPVYRIVLTTNLVQATVRFFVYAEPGLITGGFNNRMFEFWSGEGAGTGPSGWSFRVDEDGSLLYDGGGWVDTGMDLTLRQWNEIQVASDFSAASDNVVLVINGTLYDNGGAGFAMPGDISDINRIQLQAFGWAGTGAGLFYDNIWIADDVVTGEIVVAHTETNVSDRAVVDFTATRESDALVEQATDPVAADWTALPNTYHLSWSGRAIDPLAAAAGGFYRVNVKETPLLFQDFEDFTPATEFASGDFDPRGFYGPIGHYVTEGTEAALQVVSTNTTANGNPTGGVRVRSGTQSLKIDANSGGGPYMELEDPRYILDVGTTVFWVYSETGSAVGGARLFESWIDDTTTGSGVDVWALRVDENGDLYYDAGGWQLLAAGAVTHGQWNKFLVAADVSVGGSEVVNLFLNDVQVGGNIYLGRGDTLDQFLFQASANAGTGAGVFYDDITLYDTWLTNDAMTVSVDDFAVATDDAGVLEFDSILGAHYGLQYSTDGSTWTDAPYTIPGNGGKATAFDPDGLSTGKSYRIVVK